MNMTGTVDVVAVGDVFVDRRYPETAVENVADVFEEADVRVGNLEGPVSDAGEQVEFAAPWLRADPDAMAAIEAAGFDAMTLANNHSMDYGTEALLDTVDRLEAAGVAVTGAGATKSAAEQPAVVERDGLDLGLLGFDATPESAALYNQAREDSAGVNMLDVSPIYPDPHVDRPDREKLTTCVERAAADVDVLVVLFHFGIGRSRTVSQGYLARRAVDAGADCVLGTNAHLVQGVDVYGSAPIAYGLGHFFWEPLTDRYPDVKPLPRETVLVELAVDADGVATADLRPGYLDDSYRPTLAAPGTEAFEDVAEHLQTLSEEEGTTLQRRDDRLRVPL